MLHTLSEGDGSALLLVGLIEGSNSIQGDVMMTLSTNDSTAVGMSNFKLMELVRIH